MFKITSASNFQNGFTILMTVDNKIVGKFLYYLDDDEGAMNSVEVISSERNKGYGKILLMKAISVANKYGIGFELDSRGLSKIQNSIYKSLQDNGFIEIVLYQISLTDKGEDFLYN
jgi:ribosomal protein S18 acetylase RimI-like enzyme